VAARNRFAEACGYGVAVIGMEDQRLEPTFADPLPQTSAANEISGDLRLFPLGHIPSHHFAAPDVDHQIEEQPDTTDAGGQVSGDSENWSGGDTKIGPPCGANH
jgi:hypothetical protein